jgi:4-hydroxybenzoate polyprenyltransferase
LRVPLDVRLLALLRLVHPFPSILDGVVVAAVAWLAGGGAGRAILLGLAMTALQFAIGALNDIVDAPADAGRVPPKAIPDGLVTVRTARVVVVLTAGVGLGLASVVDVRLVVLGLVVLAIGFAYDLVFKGTAWSWLPFAIGIPILPVYGWFGATGALPTSFAILIPMAILAGAGLAIANARADMETDQASGTESVATRLGADRAWWAGVVLMAAAVGIGLALIGREGWTIATWVLIVVGIALVALGLAVGRGDRAARRRAWELQAIGAALAATGWVSGIPLGP